MMGLRPSPYCSIKGFQLALETMMGDRRDAANPFYWTEVVTNLPGQATYDPSRPRLWKLNPLTGHMAANVLSYVDDLRTLGSSAQQCWSVMHCLSTKLAYLGIQVAARKTRPPSTTPGPWAGAVAWSSPGGICVRSPQEKWDRTKFILQQLSDDLEQHHQSDSSPGLELS